MIADQLRENVLIATKLRKKISENKGFGKWR
jgi:hypothetical protein